MEAITDPRIRSGAFCSERTGTQVMSWLFATKMAAGADLGWCRMRWHKRRRPLVSEIVWVEAGLVPWPV